MRLGAKARACLDPSPAGGGCVRGAEGQDGREARGNVPSSENRHPQKSSELT